MVKLSRPIVYALALGAVGYAAFLLTEPAPVAKKKKPAVSVARPTPKSSVNPEDLKAQYPRYVAQNRTRNPFRPRVSAVRSLPAPSVVSLPTPVASPKPTPTVGKGWILTGITTINGQKSALVENGATNESVFLKVGDTWNGLRVMVVGEQSVVLAGGDGGQTSLEFPLPDEMPAPASTPAPAQSITPVPSAAPVVSAADGPAASRVASGISGRGGGS